MCHADSSITNTVIVPVNNTQASEDNEPAGKYLVFQLAEENFAIRAETVRELIGVGKITEVPHTPLYLKGIMDLGGETVPVIDMRLKLRLLEAEYTRETCIIVIQLSGETSSGEPRLRPVGIVVDKVIDVLPLAKVNGKHLMDIHQVLADSELLGLTALLAFSSGSSRPTMDARLNVPFSKTFPGAPVFECPPTEPGRH